VWKWWRDVSGIDGYLVRPHRILCRSQITAHSFSRHSTRCLGTCTGQASSQITSACHVSDRDAVLPSLVRSSTTHAVRDSNTSPVSMTFKCYYFKCHQQSMIKEDTVELSCLSEKLILKHVH